MINIVLFENPKFISNLSPLSLTRALFEFRVGAYSLHEFLVYHLNQLTNKNIQLFTLRPCDSAEKLSEQIEIHKLQATGLPFIEKVSKSSDKKNESPFSTTLYLNASLISSENFLKNIISTLLTHHETYSNTVNTSSSEVTAENLLWHEANNHSATHSSGTPENTLAFITHKTFSSRAELFKAIETLPIAPKTHYHTETQSLLIRELHDLLNFNEILLPEHLINLVQSYKTVQAFEELAPHVFYEKEADTSSLPLQFKHLDFQATAENPIVIRNGTKIGAYSVLTGPLYIGRQSRISPHSQLSTSSIGAHTRVGGELTHTILHDFSNKSHFGFCGHSVIGSWVNLGAGTTISNLKNSYKQAQLKRTDGVSIMTGRIFLGAFLADYVKTAILTAIYGGRTIGLAASVIDTVRNNLPNFDFSSKKLSLESLLTMQKEMFARRDKVPNIHDESLLKLIYAIETK